jgi:hypothetical protein
MYHSITAGLETLLMPLPHGSVTRRCGEEWINAASQLPLEWDAPVAPKPPRDVVEVVAEPPEVPDSGERLWVVEVVAPDPEEPAPKYQLDRLDELVVRHPAGGVAPGTAGSSAPACPGWG